MTKVCRHCKDEFTPRFKGHRPQKYCSSTCRMEAYKIRQSIEAKDQERQWLIDKIKAEWGNPWSPVDLLLDIERRLGHE